VTIDGVWIGEWILFITYTHDSELQVITASPLFSTIHRWPQHPLSFFKPAVNSPAVTCQRLLTVDILQPHALKTCLQIPVQNWLSSNLVPCLLYLGRDHTESRVPSRCTETVRLYPPISCSLRSNGSTRYNIFRHSGLYCGCTETRVSCSDNEHIFQIICYYNK
jgi:hypothetical protein